MTATHNDRMRAALAEAESFIAGFEGDDMQEGVDEMLERIRALLNDEETHEEHDALPATCAHSAGDWIITRTYASPCSIEVEGRDGAAIAKVYLTDPKTKQRTPEFMSNALLLAAAPRFYRAAKALQEWAALMGGWEAPAWELLDDAIARVEGEANFVVFDQKRGVQ